MLSSERVLSRSLKNGRCKSIFLMRKPMKSQRIFQNTFALIGFLYHLPKIICFHYTNHKMTVKSKVEGNLRKTGLNWKIVCSYCFFLFSFFEEKLNFNQNLFQRQSFFFRQENLAQRWYFFKNVFACSGLTNFQIPFWG